MRSRRAPPPDGADPGPVARLVGDRGPLLAAVLAAAAASPGLFVPYLSDDWANLRAATEGEWGRTPFGYFRPLYLLTYAADVHLFRLSPPLSHLANLALLSALAALVVVLLRVYTGDRFVAGAAGALFALHPYHVEIAGWVAARAEPLYLLLACLAALAYERWRRRPRGIAVASVVLLEAALLAKESAAVLPALLLLLALVVRSRRPSRAEWLGGHVALWAVTAAHFALLRPVGLGGEGRDVLATFGVAWIKALFYFGAAAVVPAPAEILAAAPLAWGGAAAALVAVAALAAWRRGRWSRAIWLAVPAFGILLAPSLFAFQARYFLGGGIASCLALALLLRDAGRRIGTLLACVLVAGWLVSTAVHWTGFAEASGASERLVGGLVRASREPGVEEIVIANSPNRVRGAPVNGAFGSAIRLRGGAPLDVRAAAYVDYAAAAEVSHEVEPSGEILVVTRRGAFRGVVRPVIREDGGAAVTAGGAARVVRSDERRYLVTVLESPGRVVVGGNGEAIQGGAHGGAELVGEAAPTSPGTGASAPP